MLEDVLQLPTATSVIVRYYWQVTSCFAISVQVFSINLLSLDVLWKVPTIQPEEQCVDCERQVWQCGGCASFEIPYCDPIRTIRILPEQIENHAHHLSLGGAL